MILKFITLILLLLSFATTAQIVTVSPSNPSTDDDVVITFDASLGNAQLKNFTGTVYAHCGIITTQSASNTDWKNVPTQWGIDDPKGRMTFLGNNLYQISFNIRSFFNVLPAQNVLKLAFVFRNQNGSLQGKTANNEDILYDINVPPPPPPSIYQSHTFTGNSLKISSNNGLFTLDFLSPQIAKVGFYADGIRVRDTSYAVVFKESSNWSLSDSSNFLTAFSDSSTIKIYKNPVKIELVQKGITKFKERDGLGQTYGKWSASFDISATEALYGTGSRAIDLNLRGNKFTIYNQASYGYSFGAKQLNINVPLVISSKNYGLFFDNYARGTFDLASTESTLLQYTADTLGLNYYIIDGSSIDQVISNYTLLTGRQPLTPRWALGFIQSKYGYKNETEAKSIVSSLQSEKFKLDALVLDLYWFGDKQFMGNLDWNATQWPNHTQMVSDFKSKGVKTVLITETYFTTQSTNFTPASTKGYFGKTANGSTYVLNGFWAGNSGLLDIYNPEARNWFWKFYKDKIDEGIDGWWCDLGEPESHPNDMFHINGKAQTVHNLYSHYWANMLKTKYDSIYPEKRIFNLIRSGYAGTQRYGALPWSGDISRQWDGLKAQIPLMLNSGLSGFAMMHSDAGGFTGGGQNNELYTRWLQFAAFTPIMRAHGEGVPPEPIFYPTVNKNIVRNYIDLRYSLLPTNYSLLYEMHLKGKPLAKPMSYFESDKSTTYNISDQYYWGDNMIIAPVLVEGQTSRSVYLPEGKWYNYFTNQVYTGNQTLSIASPLANIPVLVRGGTTIATTPSKSSTNAMNSDTLQFQYYFGELSEKNKSFAKTTVYEDDGLTNSGLYNQLELVSSASIANNEVKFELSNPKNNFNPDGSKMLVFSITGFPNTYSYVKANGKGLAKVLTYSDFLATDSSYYYFGSNKNLLVHLNWKKGNPLTVLLDNVQPSDSVKIPKTITGLSKNTDFAVENIYPNPATNEVTIDLNILKNGKYTVELLDTRGTIVFNQAYDLEMYNQNVNLQLTGLCQGLYVVKISNLNQTMLKKLVINKE